jgi:hypothetical protein
MSLRTARFLTGTYLVLMVVFVTWPGMLPFARIYPMVLGLPFSFAWVAAWVLGALFVLLGLDRVERRYREED